MATIVQEWQSNVLASCYGKNIIFNKTKEQSSQARTHTKVVTSGTAKKQCTKSLKSFQQGLSESLEVSCFTLY